MDNNELRNIFMQTISPDHARRTYAEDVLKNLESNPGFIYSLPTTFMADTDPIVKKVATIYYKNSLKKFWAEPSFAEIRKECITNILGKMCNCDDLTFTYYTEILKYILETEKPAVSAEIIIKIPEYIQFNGYAQNRTAVVAMLAIQKNYLLRNNKKHTLVMQESAIKAICDKLVFYFENQNFLMTRLILKYIVKISSGYTSAPYLSNINFVSFAFKVLKTIMCTQFDERTDDFLKTKKWALRYLNNMCSKASSGQHKTSDSHGFIIEQTPEIYSIGRNCILEFVKDERIYEKTVSVALDIIIFMTGNETYFPMVRADMSFYLNSLILKTHSFTDEDEMNFEDFKSNFLREKYSYYSDNIKTVSGTLFSDIVSKIKNKIEDFDDIYNYLRNIVRNANIAPTDQNLRLAYSALHLITLISYEISTIKKGEFGDFLIDFVFPLLNSNVPFMQSQACYVLEFFDGNTVKTNAIFGAFDSICGLLNSDNEILKVDAAHAISFFYTNDLVQPRFLTLIPDFVRSLLSLNNIYNLQSLTDILDSIITNYPHEVSVFSPELVGAISQMVIVQFKDLNDDTLGVITGNLRIICNLAASVNERGVVLEMFYKCHELLSVVFRDSHLDVFQEALDIVITFLYSFKGIDNAMWGLLLQILKIDMNNLTNNIEEMSNLLDNMITFGGQELLQPEIFGLIIKFIEMACSIVDQESFYDMYHCLGCKVMESLLLNKGQFLANDLEIFIKYSLTNRTLFDNDSGAWVYSLNLVMQAYVLNPMLTLQILEKERLMDVFFKGLYEKRHNFVRVHDKKTFLYFFSVLFTQQAMIDINYREMCSAFVHTLKSLPDAINKRNKLRDPVEGSEESVYNTSDEDEDYSEDYDMLDEDIYFETKLDTYNPFPHIAEVMSSLSPNSIGYNIAQSFTPQQREVVQNIFSNQQPTQLNQ